MELYEQIRKVREREQISVRELSRQFRVHRRDVRQALASAIPPPRRPSPPREAPVLGPYRAIIEAWLEADRGAPRKQRTRDAGSGSAWSRSTRRRSASQRCAGTWLRCDVAKASRWSMWLFPSVIPWGERVRWTSGTSASIWAGCSPWCTCS